MAIAHQNSARNCLLEEITAVADQYCAHLATTLDKVVQSLDDNMMSKELQLAPDEQAALLMSVQQLVHTATKRAVQHYSRALEECACEAVVEFASILQATIAKHIAEVFDTAASTKKVLSNVGVAQNRHKQSLLKMMTNKMTLITWSTWMMPTTIKALLLLLAALLQQLLVQTGPQLAKLQEKHLKGSAKRLPL